MEKLFRSLFIRSRALNVKSVCVNNVQIKQLSNCSNSTGDVCENKPPAFKSVLMTGIQPTGIPHIGNYFGAIKQFQTLQDSGKFEKVIISIADLHSITLPHNPNILRENILNLACTLMACGLDKQDTVLFQQSCVPQHTELAWILGCQTTLPTLEHLPQWKEKKNSKQEFLGLFSYPVLQAADILIYKSTHVPIGDDQVEHMELTRKITKAFNKTYGNTFPIPKNIIGTHMRLKSLRDPMKKMSKSEKDSRGRIELFDSPDEIREKLKKSITDSGFGNAVSYDPVGRPGISNLIDIYAAFSGKTTAEICSECANLNTVDFKQRVAECVIEELKPIRSKILHLKENPQHIATVLQRGKEIAQQAAAETCAEVKKLVGFA